MNESQIQRLRGRWIETAEVPDGGCFIVRHGWGTARAADHAVMPCTCVDRGAIEASTAPAVPVSSPPQPERGWDNFIRVLEREERDVDGRLVKSGSAVLCHPSQPQAFRQDNPANRREFLRQEQTWTPEARQHLWFPSAAEMPADFVSRADTCRAAKQAFLTAIDENMITARGQPIPEVPSLPLWFALLAWEPRIRKVSEIADLSAALTARILQGSGVPPEVAWPTDWRRQLTELNVLKVYALSGMTATVYVVAAFVTHVHFPRAGFPELAPPTERTVEIIQDILREQTRDRRGNRPVFTFFTAGSACSWPEQMTGAAAGDHWVVLSARRADGTWETKTPPRFADPLSLRDFLDRLRPVTQQQRISRVKSFVDDLLNSGYEGHIHLEKIAKETGYRRTAVRDALIALRDSGHYQLYSTSNGTIGIGPQNAWLGVALTSLCFDRRWLCRLACLGPAIGIIIWILKDIMMGEPFELRNFLVSVPFAYAGEWLDTRFGRWREDEE